MKLIHSKVFICPAVRDRLQGFLNFGLVLATFFKMVSHFNDSRSPGNDIGFSEESGFLSERAVAVHKPAACRTTNQNNGSAAFICMTVGRLERFCVKSLSEHGRQDSKKIDHSSSVIYQK